MAHTERSWTDAEGRLLRVAGDLIGSLRHTRKPAAARVTAREGSQSYQTLINQLPDVVFEIDHDGRWRYLNPAWERLTGYPVSETLGQAAIDYGFPDVTHATHGNGNARGQKEQFWNEIIGLVRRDGSTAWVDASVQRIHAPTHGLTGLAGTLRDTTSEDGPEHKRSTLTQFDPLTGLPNRRLALDRLAQHLRWARRRHEQVAVLFVDIDYFKNINDSLGHETGDRLLVAASQRLAATIREEDTIARLGGDEFLVIMGGIEQSGDMPPIINKILDRFQAPFTIDDHALVQTVSIGVALAPGDGDSPQALLRNADMAMYKSKAAGRSTYHFLPTPWAGKCPAVMRSRTPCGMPWQTTSSRPYSSPWSNYRPVE